MSRGMRSVGRDRATLHKNHLPNFKRWVEELDGWIIMPPTAHAYEVFRIRKYSRSGDEPDIFFYRNDKNDHITVQQEGVPLVRKWLREVKKAKKERKPVNLKLMVDNDEPDNKVRL